MFQAALLPVGAVCFLLVGLLGVIYYSLSLVPTKLTNTAEQTWGHEPIMDDDMAYLVFSAYPYHEYIHFPALPMQPSQHQGGHMMQSNSALAALSLTSEQSKAAQPA